MPSIVSVLMLAPLGWLVRCRESCLCHLRRLTMSAFMRLAPLGWLARFAKQPRGRWPVARGCRVAVLPYRWPRSIPLCFEASYEKVDARGTLDPDVVVVGVGLDRLANRVQEIGRA